MSDEQKKPDAPAGNDMRETGVVNVMTSTSIHKHPTAFFNTRLPVLEVARDPAQMSAHLEPLLAAVVKDYSVDYQRSFSGSNYAIYPYYLPVMLSGIPETDRKAILTPEQVKQFDGDGQNRYNGWWENMKRQHDQRVKGRSQ